MAHICSSPFLDAQSVTDPSKIERSWEFEADLSALFRKADKNEHIERAYKGNTDREQEDRWRKSYTDPVHDQY